MSNADVLKAGTEKARRFIEMDMLDRILIPMAKELLRHAIATRTGETGHNMTGNTANAYAVAVYSRSILCHIETSGGSIKRPIRGKLRAGRKFFAGKRRWDGDLQERTFKAPVDTDGSTEPSEALRFIEGFRPESKGFSLVVCDGVEYAEYQESVMGIDVLTRNFDYAKAFAPTMFKPIPS